MRYTVRPISDPTWLRPAGAREYSRFDSKWSSTLSLLSREVDAQQYTGFKALPAGRAMPASHMKRQEAIYLLDEYSDRDWAASDPDDLRHVYRRARAATHPDRNGGDQSLWDEVEQAARVLGATG